MRKKISIIIPTFSEEKYIASCLDSILSSSYDKNFMEIFVVDGMSQDNTPKIVKKYHETYPFIRLLHNQKIYTPYAMNLGIRASTGMFIFVLSAHASYDKDYFTKLVQHIEVLQADCVGAVLLTDVKNHTKKSNSIKKVLTSRFGVGNASFRTGSQNIKAVDTVAFGCYRKSVFEKYGLFNEKLIRNQDIELNKRIVNQGGKIYLVPDVTCTYYARENFKAFAQNNFANGKWNILTAYYTKTLNSLSPRHFIPLFFVLSLIVPVPLSVIFPKLIWITIVSLVSYLFLVTIISFKLKNRTNSLHYLIWSFLTLHFSYGLGSLAGIFAVIKKFIKGDT